jgi:hypothetical protein
MTQRLVAIAVFAGDDPDLDVERAADELRRAGFQVTCMPDKFIARLSHPFDNFIEAIKEVDCDDPEIIDTMIAAMFCQVERVVSPCGGYCNECGPVDPVHVPFIDLFDPGETNG